MIEILVTGGKGKLGLELGKFDCLNPSHIVLDVTNLDSIKSHIISQFKYVVHCAAITSVEKCETDKKLAYNVNVNGTRNVIKALQGTGIKLIYISTPCVFDGKSGNYNETSIPHPENYYGMTKLISEELVKSSGLDYLIFRTNFVAKEKWPYPKAFTDRIGTYLFADDVAKEIIFNREKKGIFHLVGNKMSMFELAKITTPDIKPMTIEDYHGKAKLTMNMCLRSNYD